MLHSGKPWVADWKHWNYTAAIKATEVRSTSLPPFLFVGGDVGEGVGVSEARREGELVDRWKGALERRGRDGGGHHAPVHLELARVRLACAASGGRRAREHGGGRACTLGPLMGWSLVGRSPGYTRSGSVRTAEERGGA
jgi:hypothetical protein